MRNPSFAVLLTALGLTFFGCSSEVDVGDGAVIVAVAAEPAVAARLARLELRVYPSAGNEPTSALTQSVALAGAPASDGGSSSTTFPLSLRVPQRGAGSLRLALLGFDTNDTTALPSIERKAYVQLERGEIKLVTLVLGAACLDQATRCADAALTCAFAGAAAGSCVPVEDAPLLPAPAPSESDPTPSALNPGALNPGALHPADAGPTATQDAAPPVVALDAGLLSDAGGALDANLTVDSGAPSSASDDAALVDASEPVPVLPPEVLPVCPVPDACPDPDFPCLRSSDGQGYACRGLYADWPMPNAEPGAKQPPHYEVDAERGVVHDLVTGLLWQRELPSSYGGCTGQINSIAGAGCTWAEAAQYCDQLTLAGQRFRLPSKIELESLVDATHPDGESLIDTLAFPRTPRAGFWTVSKRNVQGLTDRFIVSFGGGAASPAAASKIYRARCVRSEVVHNAPPDNRYQTDAQAGTVLDPYTELAWRASLTPVVATLDEAHAACAGLPGNFRVPSFKELLTLADMTQLPAALPGFPSTPFDTVLWSTTSLHGLAIAYAPLAGVLVPIDETTPGKYQTQVRCVR